MLFSAFALAVDRFVTIGRRTAQFCFGLLMRCLFLDSPSLQQEGHFVPWQDLGTFGRKIQELSGGWWPDLVAPALGTPSNSIIVSQVPVGQKNFKRLVGAIETENLKNLKTAVRLVNCIVN